MIHYQDRWAVVTGASSGLGRGRITARCRPGVDDRSARRQDRLTTINAPGPLGAGGRRVVLPRDRRLDHLLEQAALAAEREVDRLG